MAVTECSRAVYNTLEASGRSPGQTPSGRAAFSNWVLQAPWLVSVLRQPSLCPELVTGVPLTAVCKIQPPRPGPLPERPGQEYAEAHPQADSLRFVSHNSGYVIRRALLL